MVNAVTACNGGVEFHYKACRALHCNVRKMVVPIFETEESEKPCGVEVIQPSEEVDCSQFRYATPDVVKEFERDTWIVGIEL